jgi:hypothetical protein
MPNMNVRTNNWNTSIKLIDDPALSNSHKNGELLILRVENLSETSVVFPTDFGIRLLVMEGEKWVSVQNNFYYTGSNLLPTKNSYPLGLIVSAAPYISNLSSSTNIRLVIIGHAENNDNEPLGAYLDVMINP